MTPKFTEIEESLLHEIHEAFDSLVGNSRWDVEEVRHDEPDHEGEETKRLENPHTDLSLSALYILLSVILI
jgi:hypothetical protein